MRQQRVQDKLKEQGVSPTITVVDSVRTMEGGGFPVRRPFPSRQLDQIDPFLLLDHMGPVNWAPGEAVGAPDHPHRGFETVTYMLEGYLEHKDSKGHAGSLGPGDVQWMTAGAGVVHSEMPEPQFRRSGGVMNGIQLWVNLPAKDKMIQPRYQDIPAAQIPEASDPSGLVKVRVIAGESMGKGAVIDTHTPIVYLHFSVQPGGEFVQPIPPQHHAFVYVLAGEARLGPQATVVGEGQLVLLGEAHEVFMAVAAQASQGAELIVLAGVPLNEPVARYGPFVMNNEAEIHQAINDYRLGRMGQIGD